MFQPQKHPTSQCSTTENIEFSPLRLSIESQEISAILNVSLAVEKIGWILSSRLSGSVKEIKH
jgi:hypothetical protein